MASYLAVIAFVGAFLLVRYKVQEAKVEAKEEGNAKAHAGSSNGNQDKKPLGQLQSRNPHIEQGTIEFPSNYELY
jgi:hypothetical protein